MTWARPREKDKSWMDKCGGPLCLGSLCVPGRTHLSPHRVWDPVSHRMCPSLNPICMCPSRCTNPIDSQLLRDHQAEDRCEHQDNHTLHL